ncbi:hypothetical protein [Candidatus Methylacidithermus pantelleriae]|nr:hypothetical protein [Candidatus Methylacidithermus pantelleriae]
MAAAATPSSANGRTHALAALPPVGDVREVLHPDPGDRHLDGGPDDAFTGFGVHVPNRSHLFVGLLPELFSSALAAIGGKTMTQRKRVVARVAQLSAAKDFARAYGGEVLLCDLYAQHGAGCQSVAIFPLDDGAPIPCPVANDPFRFLWPTRGRDARWVLAPLQRELDASIDRGKQDPLTLKRIGALVKVHAGMGKADGRNGWLLPDACPCLLSPAGLAHRQDGIAIHLSTQGRCLVQQGVGAPLVQGYSVPDAMLGHHRNDPVTNVGVGQGEWSRRSCFFRRKIPFDRRRPHPNVSPSSGDMLRTLERTGDTLGAPIVSRADGLRRRPQLAAPQPLLPRNETVEPPPGRDALEELNGIGHGDTRRDAHKKVTVNRLDLLGDHRLPSFGVDRIQYRSRFPQPSPGQHVAPILRRPNQMIDRWIDPIPVGDPLDDPPHPTPHGALGTVAIARATEIAGFFAENL